MGGLGDESEEHAKPCNLTPDVIPAEAGIHVTSPHARLPMKRLVVTADDFGLATQVNAGISQAHRHGILTSASLMVGSPAAAEAIEMARAMPSLRVGLHLVLIEATPVLPPERIPLLVGRDGNFRTDMAAYGPALFFSRAAREQLAAEMEAQFEAYRATGLPLDHIDAHKHFHMHPAIAAELIRLAKRYGARSIRTPVEPRDVLARVEPVAQGFEARIAAPFARRLDRQLRTAGFKTPDQVFGLAWSGAMTASRVAGILRNIPAGLTELYTHPATSGGFKGAAAGYRYADELAALTDPEVVAAAKASGARLGGFSDFA